MKKRTLLATLFAGLTLTFSLAFVGCEKTDPDTLLEVDSAADSAADSGTDSAADSGTDSTVDSGTDSTPDEISFAFAEENMEGYAFRILDAASVLDGYTPFDAENVGESVNAAVVARNAKVCEIYNCKIEEVSAEDYQKTVRNSVMSGISACDMALLPDYDVVQNVLDGNVLPWTETADVDLEAEWWDHAANRQYRWDAIQVALSGAFNMNNYAGMMCYAYNRTLLDNIVYEGLYADETYGDLLYEEIRNGKWADDFDFQVGNSEEEYSSKGINGSLYDYYRTKLAGSETEFYAVSPENEWSFSFDMGKGRDFLDCMTGISLDESWSDYRSSLSSATQVVREAALNLIGLEELAEFMSPTGMDAFMSCDDAPFLNGESAFKIVRLDEIPALRAAGIDVGVAPLPGGQKVSLVDNPVFAVQFLLAKEERRTVLLMDALSQVSLAETLPAYTEYLIGGDSADAEATATRNANVIESIYQNPYYERSVGSGDRTLKYLFYKYGGLYGYLSDSARISEEAYEEYACSILKMGDFNDRLSAYLERYYVPVPVRLTENITATASNGVLTLSGSGEIPKISRIDGIKDFIDITKITSVVVEDGFTSVANYAFAGFDSLTEISLPASIAAIGNDAFYDLPLTKVVLSEGLLTIGERTFAFCESLESVNLPSTLTALGYGAFRNCRSLKAVTIPADMTDMGESVFEGCGALETVEIKGNMELLPSFTFSGCGALKSATFSSDRIRTIGVGAFSGCENLETVLLPVNLETIENNAFSSCERLESITIPDGAHTVDFSAFAGCSSLKSIALPAGLTTLGSQVFEECRSLETIVLPDGLTAIEDFSFYGCESLKTITIPKSVVRIGKYAFSGCKVADIYYGGSQTDWNAVQIGDKNNGLDAAAMRFAG